MAQPVFVSHNQALNHLEIGEKSAIEVYMVIREVWRVLVIISTRRGRDVLTLYVCV